MKDPIKISLYLNYFVFAILLNSVGIVILKAQNVYGVDEVSAATLELFKDFSIAGVSFVVASFLPRLGYRKAMLLAMAMVVFACLQMYFGNSFASTKILFATLGAAFALVKVSVYSIIGLVTQNTSEHNGLMSSVEGVFMFGIALAYFLFPAFNLEGRPDAWLNVYLLLAGLGGMAFLFLYMARFDREEEPPGSDLAEDFKSMIQLITKLVVLVFLIGAFLYVMIEQGIMSWLPSFNNKVLNLSENLVISFSA